MKNILIVDDSTSVIEALRLAFAQQFAGEANVQAAQSVAEAMRILRVQPVPDVVVLDKRLGPGENGLSVATNLLGRPDRPRILMYTDFPDETADVLSYDDPVIDFLLIKGVVRPDLVATAVMAMARNRAGELRYSEGGQLSTQFLEEVINTCLDIGRLNDLQAQEKGLLSLVKSCVRTFTTSRQQSPESLFQGVVTFNGLVSSYLNLPPRFIELLRKFPDMERALYQIPQYREHLVHQLHVFLLGFCILGEMRCRMSSLAEPQLQALKLHDGQWLRQWYIASAFHDIAYPFEKMQEWLGAFFNDMLNHRGDEENGWGNYFCDWGHLFSRKSHLDNFIRLASRVAGVFRADEVPAAAIRLELMRRVVSTQDHSIIGALILMNLLETCEPTDAAVAVCMHDTELATAISRIIKRPLSFERAPLACLLAFCDTAQEWGRVKPIPTPHADCRFSPPRFSSLRYENKAFKLALIYGDDFDETMVVPWRRDVREKVLLPFQDCWTAGRMFELHYLYPRPGESPASLSPVII